jgi:DNA-binding MarR family transcriptional regulator
MPEAREDHDEAREDSRQREAAGVRLGLLPSLLGYHLRRAQLAAFQSFNQALAGYDITPGRFGVLQVIAANPGLSQSALGTILGIDRSTVVAVIDRLEAAGLVERQPSPQDRRSYALALSPHGTVILAELERRVLAHERDIARHLDEAERRLLIDLLARIAAA